MVTMDDETLAKLGALPTGTLRLTGYWLGDCTVEWRDKGTDAERVVVTRADPNVMADGRMVEAWLTEPIPHVTVTGRIVQFGTEGEGEGVVAYEIGEVDRTYAPEPYYLLRRVAPPVKAEDEQGRS